MITGKEEQRILGEDLKKRFPELFQDGWVKGRYEVRNPFSLFLVFSAVRVEGIYKHKYRVEQDWDLLCFYLMKF